MWNIMPYRERTLWNVFEGLTVRASNAGISGAIIEEAKQLYAQVSPLCICRGPQKDALLAACLFESLKRHDTPRRPVDIAEIFQIDAKLITRGVKQFSGLLETHLHAEAKKVAAAPPRVSRKAKPSTAVTESVTVPATVKEEKPVSGAGALPEPKPAALGRETLAAVASTATINFKHFLEPALSKLETPRALHGGLVEFAARMGDMIDELGICPETTPSSLAASALAITCEKFSVAKTPAEIARVCSISAATLQKCLKRIEPWKPHLFRDSC
jgi:transcription initiation factor TFIIIB Brf1 subunit/transcription initiation factor TFIIB